MKVTWKKKTIPKAWQRAGGVVIPKEKDASNIDQFRQINLLNVEGKTFFSIVAQRMTTYLKQNNWDTRFFWMPETHKHIMASNPGCKKGKKKSACLIPGHSRCLWICSPFSHLDSLWLLSGARPSQSWSENTSKIYNSASLHLLEKLHANINWTGMKLKPSKSRSISIIRGKLVDQRFHIEETPIPLVSELPVKSFGRWYNISLKDSDQNDPLREETIKGPDGIDSFQVGWNCGACSLDCSPTWCGL